jgi:hypothetical protein
LVGYSAIGLYRDSKSLLTTLKSSNEVSTSQSSKLASDIDKSFGILKLPVIKQLTQIAGLDFTLIQSEITTLANLYPILLGDNKPKQYLVAFQNSAEARGTGGILGAYAIIQINHGQVKVVATGSNAKLKGSKELPIDMPLEFKSLYGKNPAIWQNSNLSPHFPYGAQIYSALWNNEFGQQIDGVIAVDPEGLSRILKATGPLKLPSGEKIDSGNLVYKTLSEAYVTYAKDNMARKEYLVSIMRTTIEKLQSGRFSKLELAKAIRDDILENRILIYSANSEVEKKLASTRLGGDLRRNAKDEYRAVIENTDGSKLDYYLNRSVRILSTGCQVPRQTRVEVSVENSVTNAKKLPDYVLTRADKGKPKNLITGQHRFKLFIYGPANSKLLSASRSSSNGPAGGGAMELDRPLLASDVDLAPGKSETFVANFSGGIGKITYYDQPLVRKNKLTVSDKC